MRVKRKPYCSNVGSQENNLTPQNPHPRVIKPLASRYQLKYVTRYVERLIPFFSPARISAHTALHCVCILIRLLHFIRLKKVLLLNKSYFIGACGVCTALARHLQSLPASDFREVPVSGSPCQPSPVKCSARVCHGKLKPNMSLSRQSLVFLPAHPRCHSDAVTREE